MKLEEQPPLPHAAWKKLVQDVQVICAQQAGMDECQFGQTDLVG
jgi:hypothetical protein